jgi:hypothetical protein
VGKFEDAQHEAAHVVVGVALGLVLRRATIKSDGDWLGFVLFDSGAREAELIMYAAVVAWERRTGGDLVYAQGDLEILRGTFRVRGNARLVALERAAWAILETRSALHARVTRALLERDLDARAVRELWAKTSPE